MAFLHSVLLLHTESKKTLTLPVRLDAVFFMELDSSFIAIKIDQEAHARTLPKSKKVMGP